ncbi:MAG: response regulator [Lachnospiraceae bacterium]|nr:response regulator [Lachnospiraceae bacterium]
MRKLYIADDEAVIRDGIKCVIDWEELGYTVCGESGNGEDALKDILALSPSLVLIDIRMPKLYGLEVIEKAREAGFAGKFIILSGYSDFEYAKQAMKSGVKHYLTKPLDEDELLVAVKEINQQFETAESAKNMEEFLKEKSRREILEDIITAKADFEQLDLKALELDADCYQVVMYESFNIDKARLHYQFFDLFRLAGPGNELFDHFEYKQKNILLLRGHLATERFSRFLDHYESAPQKGSPLDSLFITYGRCVKDIDLCYTSYDQASDLLKRRFFCVQGQHVLGFDDLPSVQNNLTDLDKTKIDEYSREFTDLLQTFNRRKVAESLYSLEEYLYHVDADISQVKLFMTDVYLQVKDTISRKFTSTELHFDSNSNIIEYINHRNYLYEIIIYFSNSFEKIMNSIGGSSRDSVMDDILYYIDHNYHSNIKLEMIASLFGYNSSYLGKVFNRTVGESFNSYVDKIRVNHAIELLSLNKLKVYEIAERVGYRNVDYFHKKFKKYTGDSPAEYRKKLGLSDNGND